MRKRRMNRMTRKWRARPGKRLEIPGGWYARIPTVTLDAEDETHYLEVLTGTGTSVPAAQRLVREAIQHYLEQGILKALRDSLLWRLEEFAALHPDRVEETRVRGTYRVRGFDPEKAQTLHEAALGRPLGTAQIEGLVRRVYASMMNE